MAEKPELYVKTSCPYGYHSYTAACRRMTV